MAAVLGERERERYTVYPGCLKVSTDSHRTVRHARFDVSSGNCRETSPG